MTDFICDAGVVHLSNELHLHGLDNFETFADGNKVFFRPKWIPCSEREPTEGGRYLAAGSYVECSSSKNHMVDILYWFPGTGWDLPPFVEKIVYWMKIPTCPTKHYQYDTCIWKDGRCQERGNEGQYCPHCDGRWI